MYYNHWINRIDIINQSASSSVLLNMWTGNHCVFFDDKESREYYETDDKFKLCSVTENGKIEFP